MSQDNEKRIAAESAASMVHDGMIVGLGTGSTAEFAIARLGEKVRGGLRIKGVPTSERTANRARNERIPLLDFSQVTRLDMALDGADEFDPALNLIKGGGGALFREKIVAAAADKLVIFADSSKQVEKLGRFPLPVEVNPFGWQVTLEKIKALCPEVTLRGGSDKPFVTDNHGYIIDCGFGQIDDPAELERQLKSIVGVVETGLFVGMAQFVCLGRGDKVEVLKPRA
ncbi:MAG: ribose-5-phosphate isomerase RpiA [Deltaproteobacteria bacterium]|nr:ribose-5-phosphate isomerase RpiA [Deltaproteobacteria bacterium]